MENAVEALKIAGGVLLFVLALTVSISCFSQANKSVTAIVSMRDRDVEIAFDQIRPSKGLTRTVGVETIVPTMYTAYYENIEIFFKTSSGDAIPIYYDINQYGEINTDENGEIKIYSISAGLDEKRLDMILSGKNNLPDYIDNDIKTKYEKQYIYDDGFYNYLEGKKFEEYLGEYYEGDTSNSGSTSTKIKKRVITYKEVQDP